MFSISLSASISPTFHSLNKSCRYSSGVFWFIPLDLSSSHCLSLGVNESIPSSNIFSNKEFK